jgi:hypothetical protein
LLYTLGRTWHRRATQRVREYGHNVKEHKRNENVREHDYEELGGDYGDETEDLRNTFRHYDDDDEEWEF